MNPRWLAAAKTIRPRPRVVQLLRRPIYRSTARQVLANKDGLLGRSFSSSSAQESSRKNPSLATSMRNMMKPFFMKCHPDVQTSSTAKEVNLAAIQNLNAFLDSVEAKLKPNASGRRLMRNETTVFDIDFCVVMEERIRGKKEDILCRRKVELTLPTKLLQALNAQPSNNNINNHPSKYQLEFQTHVQTQLVKLLHVAGLKAPKQSQVHQEDQTTTLEEYINQTWSTGKLSPAQVRMARRQKYERNREAFVANIDWKRYDQIYQETLLDVEADEVTSGLIRDHPQRRIAHIAEILSRIRIQEKMTGNDFQEEQEVEQEEVEVDPVMQLVAIRRLSLLLDEHFDDLRLEDMGRMWESTVIVLCAARDYNSSPSALYKRRKRQTKGDVLANDGFAITLHHDNSVTMHIPVDFRDEELLSQWKRHVNDYASLLALGLEDIFPQSSSAATAAAAAAENVL